MTAKIELAPSVADLSSQHSVIEIATGLASATGEHIMRKQLLGLATFGVFLTLSMGSVQAQTGYRIQTDIPFDFTAGESSLRAGIYSVEMISDNALLVRSIDGKKGVQLLTRATAPGGPEQARLIFNRYGDRYFLSQVCVGGGDVGRELHLSGAELRLRRELSLAKSDAKSQKVEVAVR